MKEEKLFETMEDINESYVADAHKKTNKKRVNFRMKWVAVAACLCLAVLGSFAVYYKIVPNNKVSQTEQELVFSEDKIVNLVASYDGELLADSFVLSGATDCKAKLCYNGPNYKSSAWKTISIVADYSDYSMNLDCSFDDSYEKKNDSNAVKVLKYDDTSVYVYLTEPTSRYECGYKACFEYGTVYYELTTQSDNPNRIYEILDAVLGKCPGIAGQYTNIMGYDGYIVAVEETAPDFMTLYYCTEENGKEKCIAELFGFFGGEERAFIVDFDGDGITELVCNCMYGGDGAERVFVYRNNEGIIEQGYLDEIYSDIENEIGSAGAIKEKYDPETGTFHVVVNADGRELKNVSFTGMDYFTFKPYETTKE